MNQRQQDYFRWEAQSRDLIALRRSYVDMAGGDLAAGVLLSQLVYWHSPDEQGKSRLRVNKEGQWWIAKKREDWWTECRLSAKQFDRAAALLEKLGLVVLKIFRFNGSPTKHIRINLEKFFQALDYVTQNAGEVFQSILNKTGLVRNSPKGKNQLTETVKSKSPSPKGRKPSSSKGDFDLPQRVNSNLTEGEVPITESTTKTTTENLPPLTPPQEEREERAGQAESVEVETESSLNSLASGQDCTNCLEKETNLSEDQPSAPPPRNVKKSEAPLRRYNSALGIRPPEQWKSRQQRAFDWVPDGPWLVGGKLDGNFVDWQARDWQKAYGEDIHKKKADVLRYFKKDPANLAIAWSQYQGEQHHRYSNAALRMQNGLQIQPDEQQQLWAHRRAVTEALPDDINPVAVEQDGQRRQQACSQRMLAANVVTVPGREVVVSDADFANCDDCDQKLRASFPNSPTSANGNHPQLFPYNCSLNIDSASVPSDSHGFAENPDAYQVWKPKPVEGETATPEQFRAKLAELSHHLSMPQPQKTERQAKNELEELNEWLADPILREEVRVKVMRSDHLAVEFDEQGQEMKVVEVAR